MTLGRCLLLVKRRNPPTRLQHFFFLKKIGFQSERLSVSCRCLPGRWKMEFAGGLFGTGLDWLEIVISVKS